MKTIPSRKLLLPALLIMLLTCASADDVIIVRNQWRGPLHIWVNDSYQGFVPAGVVAYVPQEGFVTPDSGFKPDGTLKMEHAYGGWESRGTFSIRAAGAPLDFKGERVSFFSEGSEPDRRGKPKYWAFGNGQEGKPVPPTDDDAENAEKMQQGGEPQEIRSLLSKGTTDYQPESGGTVIGGVNSAGTAVSLKMAGTTGGDFTKWAGVYVYDTRDLNVHSDEYYRCILQISRDGTVACAQQYESGRTERAASSSYFFPDGVKLEFLDKDRIRMPATPIADRGTTLQLSSKGLIFTANGRTWSATRQK